MSPDQHPELASIRTDYDSGRLLESEAGGDPMALFERWLGEALEATQRGEMGEPTAVTVATVRPDGRPSARVLLLKDVDDRGFTFYTNQRSDKGEELHCTPFAAATVWWPPLYRQIRIEGPVERVADADADAYFAVRPRGSQVAAVMSQQSRPIESAEALAQAYARTEAELDGTQVPRPEHWGGFRIVPDRFEFWQGRPSRLHDRLCYLRTPEGWTRTRLQP